MKFRPCWISAVAVAVYWTQRGAVARRHDASAEPTTTPDPLHWDDADKGDQCLTNKPTFVSFLIISFLFLKKTVEIRLKGAIRY